MIAQIIKKFKDIKINTDNIYSQALIVQQMLHRIRHLEDRIKQIEERERSN